MVTDGRGVAAASRVLPGPETHAIKHAHKTLGTTMRALLFGLFMLVIAACDPLWVMSGGALSGEPTAPPADWTEVAREKTVQVETRPADPYSINIWGVGVGADFYIAAASETNRWVVYLAEDPNVRLRIGKALYDLRAVRVTDAAELARVQRAYETKYDVGDENNRPQETFVYRLDRRR